MEAAQKHPDVPEWMTTDEFLVWDAPWGWPWQLVDGVPQMMAPTNRTHGAIQAELATLLGNHFVERGSSCSVVIAPGIIPRANAARNFRIPDLGVTCTGYEDEETALSEPVLLAEILSPSNKSGTWSNAWTYTTIPSVQEILIVRSDRIGAELLRRNPDGTWPDRPLSLEGGELTLESLGFTVSLQELYRTTRLARS